MKRLIVNTSRIAVKERCATIVKHAVSKGILTFETAGAQQTLDVLEAAETKVRVLAKVSEDDAQKIQSDSVVLVEEDTPLEKWDLPVKFVPGDPFSPKYPKSAGELIGVRPLLTSRHGVATWFQDDPSVRNIDRSEARSAYVAASQKALDRFNVTEGDDDTRAGAEWIVQLIADLNTAIPQFPSGGAFDHELISQIGPMIHEKFDGVDDESADILYDFLTKLSTVVKCTALDRAIGTARDHPTRPFQGGDVGRWALNIVIHHRPDLDAISIDTESPADIDRAIDVLHNPQE